MSSSSTQRALVVRTYGGEFELTEIPRPVLTDPFDILVRVRAAALNPVDYKVKNGEIQKKKKGEKFDVDNKVIGYDAAGIVEQIGSSVTQFKVGDEVYYSGSINRQGSFQQYQLVDARITGKKPKSLSFEEAAAIPLTAITAYEAMKELLQVKKGEGILITAGAGGVGSIALQLAKHWELSPIIATASRKETVEWAKSQGADIVIDHSKGISQEFQTQNLSKVPHVFNTFSDKLINDIVPVMLPNSGIVGINGDIGPEQIPAISSMFPLRIRYLQEFMFARPVFHFDEQYQGNLLNEISELIDAGKLKTTLHSKFDWKNVAEAFKVLEDRKTIGKIALTIE